MSSYGRKVTNSLSLVTPSSLNKLRYIDCKILKQKYSKISKILLLDEIYLNLEENTSLLKAVIEFILTTKRIDDPFLHLCKCDFLILQLEIHDHILFCVYTLHVASSFLVSMLFVLFQGSLTYPKIV